MEKMERYLRMGTSTPTILAGGDQINFTVDTNGNPSSTNLVPRSLTFSTGDGDESTAADNTMTYDPNTAVSGDQVIIMTNVRRSSTGNAIFAFGNDPVTGQPNTKIITMSLRVSDVIATYSSSTYNGTDQDISTNIYLRN